MANCRQCNREITFVGRGQRPLEGNEPHFCTLYRFLISFPMNKRQKSSNIPNPPLALLRMDIFPHLIQAEVEGIGKMIKAKPRGKWFQWNDLNTLINNRMEEIEHERRSSEESK